MPDPSLPDLIQLCERVLATDIGERELRQAWPQEPHDENLSELRETLFSALEHLPGRVVDGHWRLDPDAWRRTPEYGDIELYLRRLRQAARG
jgi:hypothetical protein